MPVMVKWVSLASYQRAGLSAARARSETRAKRIEQNGNTNGAQNKRTLPIGMTQKVPQDGMKIIFYEDLPNIFVIIYNVFRK